MEQLRQSLVTELERNFAKEKASWQKSEDEITKDKIQAEIAMAKMDWAKVSPFVSLGVVVYGCE